MLPGLSGEEVLPHIKGIPVIIMSAKVDVDNKVALLLGGAVDYMTKPSLVRVSSNTFPICKSSSITNIFFKIHAPIIARSIIYENLKLLPDLISVIVFLMDLQSMFDHLVDITEPICQRIDSNLASMSMMIKHHIAPILRE